MPCRAAPRFGEDWLTVSESAVSERFRVCRSHCDVVVVKSEKASYSWYGVVLWLSGRTPSG